MPLLAVLGSGRRDAAYDEATLEILRDRARTESRRVLAGRGQLGRLREIAGELGIPLVLLKGAVDLVEEESPLALGDLDVLVPAEAACSLHDRLLGEGYGAFSGAGLRHLPALYMPGGIAVEIHVDAGGDGVDADRALATSVPIAGFTGLHSLAPAEHMWGVLVHSTVDHFSRRGRLRDLLLIGRAIRRADTAALEDVSERVARHRFREALTCQLGAAVALEPRLGRILPGFDPLEADPFESDAAAHYLLWELLRPFGLPPSISGFVFDAAAARLGGREERRWLWSATSRVPEGSAFPRLAAVERRLGPLRNPLRVGLRRARLAALSAAAVPISREARRISATA